MSRSRSAVTAVLFSMNSATYIVVGAGGWIRWAWHRHTVHTHMHWVMQQP